MLNPVPDLEWRLLSPIIETVTTMIELGNKKNSRGTYKGYFEWRGIKHVSVDWNGKDGALPMDLNHPHILPKADVVTNFGTSEHVENQIEVFENIDRFMGKWAIHVVPLIGNWYGHGLKTCGRECYKYTEEDIMELGLKYGYTIEDLFIAGKPNKQLICVRFARE